MTTLKEPYHGYMAVFDHEFLDRLHEIASKIYLRAEGESERFPDQLRQHLPELPADDGSDDNKLLRLTKVLEWNFHLQRYLLDYSELLKPRSNPIRRKISSLLDRLDDPNESADGTGTARIQRLEEQSQQRQELIEKLIEKAFRQGRELAELREGLEQQERDTRISADAVNHDIADMHLDFSTMQADDMLILEEDDVESKAAEQKKTLQRPNLDALFPAKEQQE